MLMENINNAFLRKERSAIIRYLKFQLPRQVTPKLTILCSIEISQGSLSQQDRNSTRAQGCMQGWSCPRPPKRENIFGGEDEVGKGDAAFPRQ